MSIGRITQRLRNEFQRKNDFDIGRFGVSRFQLRTRLARISAAVVMLLALSVNGLRAAEKVAVVSLRASDQLFSDVTYLMKATGTDALAQLFLPQVQQYFKGVDGKRPIGMVLQMDGSQMVPLVFIPVTDLQTVLGNLKEHLGTAEDVGNGVFELQGPQPLYVKEQAGWAYVGQAAQHLSDLPANPDQLLDGLDARYTIGVRAYLDKVPAPYKQMLVDRLREGVEANNASSEEDKQAAMEQIQRMVDESETLTVVLQVSSRDREMYFEGGLKPVAGTKFAGDMDQIRDMKTNYAGFVVPGAAVSGNLASVVPADKMPQTLSQIDQFEQKTLEQIARDAKLDDATRAGAKQLVATFFKIVRGTVKTGQIDSCTSVILQPQTISIVSASHVASGTEVEDAVKQLVKLSESDPRIAFKDVKLNAAEHNGVRFHSMSVPVPEDPKARMVLGDAVAITVGAGKESAYLAVGPGGVEQLRKLIDASAKAGAAEVQPFSGQISVLPILEFAKSIEPNPLLASLIQMLEDHRELDQVRVGYGVNNDGMTYRFTIEEGVLKLIGQAVPLMGMRMGG